MDLTSPPDRHCRQAPPPRASRRWLLLVVAAVIGVRAVQLTQPLVGNFATKQAVYAMIARNWALERAPIWQPTIDCLTDDRRSWHLMEWPATSFATAVLWRTFGGSLDVWGRVVGIACSAAAVIFAYLLAQRWFGETAGRAAALVIGFAPQSIAYGRGFLLEPSLVAFSLAAVYAFDAWLRGGRLAWTAVAAVAASLAVATKVYMLLLFVPFLVSAWRTPRPAREFAAAGLVFAAAFTPTVAWYAWVAQVSTVAGPAVDFHPFTRAEVHAWPHPLLASPSFYLQVVCDLATVALTPLGLALLIVGMCDRRFRPHLPWLVASLGLIILLPLKFHAANYYYLILLPPATLAIGVGWQRTVERFAPGKPAAALIVVVGLLISARFAIGPGYRIPAEDASVTAAADALRDVAAVDEPIATLHGSTIDLLYYCDRPGWALNIADDDVVDQLAALRNRGAELLVVANVRATLANAEFTAWRNLRPIVAAGNDWQIVRFAAPPEAKTPQSTSVATTRGTEFQSPPAPRTVAR